MIAWSRRRLTLKGLWQMLIEAGPMVAGIFILFIGPDVSRMLASTLPVVLMSAMGILLQPFMIIIFFLLIYLVLGAIVIRDR
jgi:hypothetical protein